ncbi:hypothetical protein WA026_015015, partial [Henosepilachna vigintioctopunctata]
AKLCKSTKTKLCGIVILNKGFFFYNEKGTQKQCPLKLFFSKQLINSRYHSGIVVKLVRIKLTCENRGQVEGPKLHGPMMKTENDNVEIIKMGIIM